MEGSFGEVRDALARLEEEAGWAREAARRAAYDEAIRHFQGRAAASPGQRVTHEAVAAVLAALRDGFWGRGGG